MVRRSVRPCQRSSSSAVDWIQSVSGPASRTCAAAWAIGWFTLMVRT
jgi:hypothetical protein